MQTRDGDCWEPSSWAALLLPLEKFLLLVLARFSPTIKESQLEHIDGLKQELDRAVASVGFASHSNGASTKDRSAELRATHKSLCT